MSTVRSEDIIAYAVGNDPLNMEHACKDCFETTVELKVKLTRGMVVTRGDLRDGDLLFCDVCGHEVSERYGFARSYLRRGIAELNSQPRKQE